MIQNYNLAITEEEIGKSDGYLERCTCGYPYYRAYNISPENGDRAEYEYFIPIDIIQGSPTLWQELKHCPNCNKALETSY